VIVAEDADADLAVLQVVGVKDSPRPIDCERTPELVETMPVLAFGFPFGEDLDPEKKNPAITITRGAVSSLRYDRRELKEVQLDLDLNPGNSGGPVVDERGALIGVAVARITDARRIGFAVPVHKLNRLLKGHIQTPHVIQTSITQGRTQVRVLARAADPFGKLRSPTLLYGLANELRMPQQGPNGWAKLAGAKSSIMTIQGTQAAATLALTPPDKGELKILVQVTYQTDSGQTVIGAPVIFTLNAPSAQPNPAKPPVATAHLSRRPKGEELAKLLADLKSPDEAVRQRAANTLQQAPPHQRRDEVRRGLQDLLTSKETATRTAGAQALAACDPKQAAPALTKLLSDEAPDVRHAVLNLLKELKDSRAIEALGARFPEDPLLVGEALKVMGPDAEKAVLPYLAEKYAGPTRFWAMGVIKEIGTAAALPALEAVQGVDRVHVSGVLEAVRERLPLTAEEWPGALDDLKSDDHTRRVRASRKIAASPPIDDRRADVVSRLELLLNDRVRDVQIAAVKGLARWAGKQSIPTLAKRLEGFDPGLHAAIIDVLAESKSDEAAAAIAKRVLDIHDRGKATAALKTMDPRVAEKALLLLLADPNAFNRREVIQVLADVGGRDSIAPLEKLANDNNVFYSEPAKQALMTIKDRLEANETK
jgi:HEAT repeat protein